MSKQQAVVHSSRWGEVWQPVPCPVKGCNGEVAYLNISLNEANQKTLLTEKKWADMRLFYEDEREKQNDALVLGMGGSGKTSALDYLIGYFWTDAYHHRHCICTSRYGEGAMVVYRALKHKFEYLAFLEAGARINLIMPRGAEFKFDHPLLQRSYHDLYDFRELFGLFRKDAINVIATGQFLRKPAAPDLIDDELYYDWWGKWFDSFLSWKMQEFLDTRIILFIDEMQDIVPGHGQKTYKAHTQLGNRIRSNIDAFRSANTKLIATTHSLTQLDKAFRDRFPYWFIKTTKPESVPDEPPLNKYANYIQSLPQNRIIVTDHRGKINDRPARVWILTKNYSVKTVPMPLTEEIVDASSKDVNRARLASMIWALRNDGFSLRDIAAKARWRTQARVFDFCKEWPEERIAKILPPLEGNVKPSDTRSQPKPEKLGVKWVQLSKETPHLVTVCPHGVDLTVDFCPICEAQGADGDANGGNGDF